MIGLSIWIGSMVTWAVFAPKLNKFDPTKNTTSVLRDCLLYTSDAADE